MSTRKRRSIWTRLALNPCHCWFYVFWSHNWKLYTWTTRLVVPKVFVVKVFHDTCKNKFADNDELSSNKMQHQDEHYFNSLAYINSKLPNATNTFLDIISLLYGHCVAYFELCVFRQRSQSIPKEMWHIYIYTHETRYIHIYTHLFWNTPYSDNSRCPNCLCCILISIYYKVYT